MAYYADLDSDLPSPHKRKRVIFYRQGLKIYGLLPFILQRQLKAKFFSGSIAAGGVLMSMGSFEPNWTAVPYTQSSENLTALLHWLFSERGFEVAIASEQDWDDDIFSANVYRMPPKTWFPFGSEARQGFFQVAGSLDKSRRDVIQLLAVPMGKEAQSERE